MAFGILQTFLKRTTATGALDELPTTHQCLRQFITQGNTYSQMKQKIIEEERPPMLNIAAYRKKFQIDKSEPA